MKVAVPVALATLFMVVGCKKSTDSSVKDDTPPPPTVSENETPQTGQLSTDRGSCFVVSVNADKVDLGQCIERAKEDCRANSDAHVAHFFAGKSCSVFDPVMTTAQLNQLGNRPGTSGTQPSTPGSGSNPNTGTSNNSLITIGSCTTNNVCADFVTKADCRGTLPISNWTTNKRTKSIKSRQTTKSKLRR